MKRTNISIDHRVFEEFASQAESKSMTLYTYTNEWLTAASKLATEGATPEEVCRLWQSVALLKQMDVITLPSDFIDDLISKLYVSDKFGLLLMFRKLGGEVSAILKIAAKDLKELEKLAVDFIELLPLKRFKIYVPEASNGTLEVDVVGAGRRIESTECALEFLVGIINGYGYEVAKQEINVGTIRLWVLPKG